MKSRPSRRRLAIEAAMLYFVAPLAMAIVLPPTALFPALFSLTAIGILLLHLTPDFRWLDLLKGWRTQPWLAHGVVALATLVGGFIIVQLTIPAALFQPARSNPASMAMIFALYPVLSALPQEIIFRSLFFCRYSPLLPHGVWTSIMLNAAVFSAAHLMYWSWFVAIMTFVGGLGFAWAYQARGYFPASVLMHAIAGWIVFGVGLGAYFYSGNVSRPF